MGGKAMENANGSQSQCSMFSIGSCIEKLQAYITNGWRVLARKECRDSQIAAEKNLFDACKEIRGI